MNMNAIRNPIIYPVVLAVPDKKRELTGKEKVSFLSRHARRALEISAEKCGVQVNDLKKDENGAPLPFEGYYWSLTHKNEYVGGVTAPEKTGMDIEKIRPCSDALYRKTVHESEWSLSNADPMKLFFRYWTSKESVLKASGTGIRDLSKCRIIKIIDNDRLMVFYKNREWLVEHFYFDRHIASVIKNNFDIKWSLLT